MRLEFRFADFFLFFFLLLKKVASRLDRGQKEERIEDLFLRCIFINVDNEFGNVMEERSSKQM